MDNCKTCGHYRAAEKPIMGFHEYTGTCFERRPMRNRVRANGYCEDYAQIKELKTTT